jgi:quaternary ammonium compound-resistance protein SugE
MPWILLLIAGLFEIAWAIGLKLSDGFTRPLVTLATLGAMAISLTLLALAMKSLPVGTAYAVWTGIGALGTALVGMLAFGDPTSAARVLCLMLILCGVLGLKLS